MKKTSGNSTKENPNLRKQAEKITDKRESQPAATEHALRLITELQTHQIELELQNDEIRKTQEELALEREKFADLYNFAPLAYFTFDEHDLIADVNLAGAEMLGVPRQRLLGHPFAPYVESADLKKLMQSRQKALEEGKPQICELNLRLRDKTRMSIQAHTAALRPASKIPQLWRTIMIDVTEKKRLEAELRESEARLKAVFDQANDMILVTNVRDEIIAANLRAEDVLGYSREELQKMRIPDIQAPGYKGGANVVQTEIKRYGGSIFEGMDQRKDGTLVPVEISVSGIETSQGNLHVSVVRDITERKRAEAALIESEGRFRSMFEKNNAVMLLIEPDTGQILDANLSAVEFYGYPLETLKRMKIQEINTLPEDEVARLRREAASEVRNYFTFAHRLANGEIRSIESYSTPVTFEGNLALFSIIHDVTKRQQAEAALRENEERYRQLFESAPIGILSADREGRIMEANPKLLDILGSSSLEATKSINLFSFPPLEKAGVSQAIRECFETGRTVSGEALYKSKWGKSVHVQYSVAPNGRAADEVRWAQILVADITERKLAEQQILQLNAALEQRVEERTRELREAQDQLVEQEKLATLGKIAGGMGHELRNPLGVISNAVYFLQMVQPEASEKVKNYLNLIHQNVGLSEKIVSNLLDFTKIEKANPAYISLTRLIPRVLEQAPPPDSVQADLDLPPDISMIYADPQHVVQILHNIVLNAYQAMPNGGQLRISACVKKDTICIAVRDTGMGISAENKRKVFEPLFTTKPQGVGLGLGLAVCKKLAEANKGGIEVESDGVPDKGSVFTFWLPVK